MVDWNCTKEECRNENIFAFKNTSCIVRDMIRYRTDVYTEKSRIPISIANVKILIAAINYDHNMFIKWESTKGTI